ncbi:hypothetical protein JTB14_012098 [Gonioctena quinquepunctata]|nr:hypothetical protein JTB14_012098 [Gonioctena quinquepunctata]
MNKKFIRRLIQNEEEDWHEIIQIGKNEIKIKLDPGAQCNILPKWISDRLECKLKIHSLEYNLQEESIIHKKQVREELDKMVDLGVIKPIKEPTPVVSPMVVVEQKDKLRICIAPTDVNKYILRRHYPLKTIEEMSAEINGAKYFTLLDCKRGFWQIKVTDRTQKLFTFSTPWAILLH